MFSKKFRYYYYFYSILFLFIMRQLKVIENRHFGISFQYSNVAVFSQTFLNYFYNVNANNNYR